MPDSCELLSRTRELFDSLAHEIDQNRPDTAEDGDLKGIQNQRRMRDIGSILQTSERVGSSTLQNSTKFLKLISCVSDFD